MAKVETRKQIDARIRERFELLGQFASASITGDIRAMIGSGPPGLGKSFDIEKILKEHDPSGETYTISKGYVLTTGLLKLLYQHRKPNQVIVFDDADTIFGDINSINLLKAVCDTCETRVVSYLCESNLIDEKSAEKIPQTFKFEGSVIFLTNMDFDKLIEKGNKFAPHLEALVSRAHYIDLSLKSREDFIVRIGQVMDEGLLDGVLPKQHHSEIMDFINDESNKLRELSLRMALKLAHCFKMGKNWKNVAKVTCCRQ